jgi:hypothetical protein
MSTAKRLAWIAAGYAVSAGVGIAAVAINELRMSEDVLQGSPGMVAFGDVVLFVFVSGLSTSSPADYPIFAPHSERMSGRCD